MQSKPPTYIEGIGWRRATEHNQKRRHRSHDYSAVGTYMVTIVVEGRTPVFGTIAGDIHAHPGTTSRAMIGAEQGQGGAAQGQGGAAQGQGGTAQGQGGAAQGPNPSRPCGTSPSPSGPSGPSSLPFGEGRGEAHSFGEGRGGASTVLSPLGESVLRTELPKLHALYPMAEIWQACIMPDHLHLIVRINAPLPPGKHLGNLIAGLKGGISRAWGGGTLFEPGYNDRILMRDGQLENWKAYLAANPYRWLVRHQRPELMRRALCVVIGGVRYGAFGNFMLLRHPEKVQVFFHRRMPQDTALPGSSQPATQQPADPDAPCRQAGAPLVPTEQTLFWQREHARLMEAAAQGDVLVTPGISECEKRIKNECLAQRHRLIHLQAEPIGRYWKPEKSRFEACEAGTLLVLAPWAEDLNDETAYDRFHHLNALAAAICQLDAAAPLRIANS